MKHKVLPEYTQQMLKEAYAVSVPTLRQEAINTTIRQIRNMHPHLFRQLEDNFTMVKPKLK